MRKDFFLQKSRFFQPCVTHKLQ